MSIAIVGAGIGGLVAAGALHARGVDVDVYEQASDLGEVGAGVQLGPNAVKVLDALGLAAAVREIAAEPQDTVSYHWSDGGLRLREPLSTAATKIFGAPYLMAHRADLHGLLCGLLPASKIHLGKRCVDCSSLGGSASISFQDGTSTTADVLLAADGINSVIRKRLFEESPARFTHQICWRAIVPIDKVPRRTGPNNDVVISPQDYFRWLGPTGHVICYPIRRGTLVNIFAGRVSEQWLDESWSTPSGAKEMIEAYDGWDPTMLEMFSHVTNCFKWGIYDRDPLPSWHAGRTVLMGDAAHPMMPTLAQGAAITMEDGFAIALAIANEEDLDVALAKYDASRRPRASKVQLQARAQFDNNRKTPAPQPINCDWIYSYNPYSAVAS